MHSIESDEDDTGNDDADGNMSDDDDLSDAGKVIDHKLTSENREQD